MASSPGAGGPGGVHGALRPEGRAPTAASATGCAASRLDVADVRPLVYPAARGRPRRGCGARHRRRARGSPGCTSGRPTWRSGLGLGRRPDATPERSKTCDSIRDAAHETGPSRGRCTRCAGSRRRAGSARGFRRAGAHRGHRPGARSAVGDRGRGARRRGARAERGIRAARLNRVRGRARRRVRCPGRGAPRRLDRASGTSAAPGSPGPRRGRSADCGAERRAGRVGQDGARLGEVVGEARTRAHGGDAPARSSGPRGSGCRGATGAARPGPPRAARARCAASNRYWGVRRQPSRATSSTASRM